MTMIRKIAAEFVATFAATDSEDAPRATPAEVAAYLEKLSRTIHGAR